MELKITLELKQIWKSTLQQLSGSDRRLFMASVVKALGRGGALSTERDLGWDRSTGSVTADFMADRLSELWPTLKKTVILHIPW